MARMAQGSGEEPPDVQCEKNLFEPMVYRRTYDDVYNYVLKACACVSCICTWVHTHTEIIAYK